MRRRTIIAHVLIIFRHDWRINNVVFCVQVYCSIVNAIFRIVAVSTFGLFSNVLLFHITFHRVFLSSNTSLQKLKGKLVIARADHSTYAKTFSE